MTSATWQSVSPRTLYNHIAHSILGHPSGRESEMPGRIALHDHQEDAVRRITRALDEFGGALLADSVGLGKTYIALGVARQYDHVHVVAPATLLPMWRKALKDTEIHASTVHSLQSLSRKPMQPCVANGRCLVVVDEAHHLRTSNTIRYANAAQFLANRHVLLLSATPIHNRARDLQNLLALFLGNRADVLDDSALARYIVRRTTTPSLAAELPRVREHAPFRVAENSQVLEALLTLPPPLPLKDGSAAGALIRLGLLQAWCSSDAALTDSLRRREARGEALLHALAHGRYPTQHELRSYIVSTDALQLGFPELLVATATGDSASLLVTVSTHLDALHKLLQLHVRVSNADAERTSILRALLRQQSGESSPIIAFSHFASTVQALYRALSDLAGVASLTSQGGRIASGRVGRQELIAQFAPRAHERPPPPAHQRIQLLLTTDLLSEGVNLQDAATLVHLDLPWTDASRAQRVGRLARLGSFHEFVDVFTFAPPPGIDATLRIVQTLKRKALVSDEFVGTSGPVRPSAAQIATRIHERMKVWLTGSYERGETTAVACVHASITGFIAVISHNGEMRVVAHDSSSTSDALPFVGQTIEAITPCTEWFGAGLTPAARCDAAMSHRVACALRAIHGWREDVELRSSTGPSARAVAPANAAALRAIASCMARTTAANRAGLVALAEQAEYVVQHVRGAGAERAIEQWLALPKQLPANDWLRAITNFPALKGTPRRPPEVSASHQPEPSFRVDALLLLSSD